MCSYLQTILATIIGVCAAGAAALDESRLNSVQRFQTDNPRAHVYYEEGEPAAFYGPSLSEGDTPQDSVANFLTRHGDVLGPGLGKLTAIEVGATGVIARGVKYDRATDTYEFSLISFEQTVARIPVFRSRIGFLVRNEPSCPLVLTALSLRDVNGFRPPDNADPVVTQRMQQSARRMMGVGEIDITDAKPVIWAGVGRMRAEPQLAVIFTASSGSPATYPAYQKRLFVADAQNGAILYSEDNIFRVDVIGNVSGRATDGVQSGDCDPQSLFAMPYGEVRIKGGNTAFADANGDFVIPNGGNGQVTVESLLRGPWFEVFDFQNGGETPLLTMNVTPPGPANLIHNDANNSEFPLAVVNAYLHSNIVRDFVLGYVPNFPVIDAQQGFDVNVNIDGSCGAFYIVGDSINFDTSGSGCSNTANSTVVYHEYGHHLIEVTDNGQAQMGEGVGDTMAVLITDQPWLASGFQDCNVPLRNAINNIQYPCNGIHSCAGLLSGAVWDTRNELVVTEPADYQDILSSLFLNMLIVRGGTQGENGERITPFITLVMLQLDDNDGDINNGTPHYFEIASGFGAHNLDAPPILVVCAGSGELVEGVGETGDFNATCGSDDSYWTAHGASLFFQISDPVVQFELTATVPAGFSGGTISADIEASKQSDLANLNLRALFNFATGSYVSLPGIMPLATADAVQNFVLPAGSDPADFIEPGTNEVRLLLQTIQTSGLPNVRTQLDDVLFFFE